LQVSKISVFVVGIGSSKIIGCGDATPCVGSARNFKSGGFFNSLKLVVFVGGTEGVEAVDGDNG